MPILGNKKQIILYLANHLEANVFMCLSMLMLQLPYIDKNFSPISILYQRMGPLKYFLGYSKFFRRPLSCTMQIPRRKFTKHGCARSQIGWTSHGTEFKVNQCWWGTSRRCFPLKTTYNGCLMSNLLDYELVWYCLCSAYTRQIYAANPETLSWCCPLLVTISQQHNCPWNSILGQHTRAQSHHEVFGY